jgi:HK97 family phage major capsid protein
MADSFEGVQGIERGDVAALVPEQVSSAMLESLSDTSAILALATRIPVSRRQVRFPILSALPAAYFVSGDLGLKQTTKAEWDNKYMNIEELAVIVPIPEAVLDDSGFDIFGSIRPLLEAAIARKFDAAVAFGEDKPGSWDDDLVSLATDAGNTVVLGTAQPEDGGIAEDFNQLFGLVEDGGYDVTGVIAAPRLKTRIRSARDTSGQRLADMTEGSILGARFSTRPFLLTSTGPSFSTSRSRTPWHSASCSASATRSRTRSTTRTSPRPTRMASRRRRRSASRSTTSV